MIAAIPTKAKHDNSLHNENPDNHFLKALYERQHTLPPL